MGGRKRLTQEQAEKRSLDNGFRLLSQYVSARGRYTFECLKCGTDFETDYGTVVAGKRKCPTCHNIPKPMTEDRLISILASKEIVLLEILEKGVSLSSAMVKIRHSCGHVWDACVRNVAYTTGCPVCNHGKPVTLERVSEVASEKGYHLVSCETPLRGVSRVRLICKRGHISERDLDSLLYEKSACMECSKEDTKADLARLLIESDICILPHPLDEGKLLCKHCGHVWKGDLSYYAKYRKDHIEGCPKCAEHGRIATDLSKPMWLYYLRLDLPTGLYYKIGITKHGDILQRFQKRERSYITVLERLYYDVGRDAHEHEQQLLLDFDRYRYKGEPVLKSGGSTELFTRDVLFLDKSNPDTLNQKPL